MSMIEATASALLICVIGGLIVVLCHILTNARMNMNEILKNLLDSELSDYGLSWDHKETVDEHIEINISLDGEYKTTERFKVENDCIYIFMGGCHWEIIRGTNTSIKYFWMKIAPEVWGK